MCKSHRFSDAADHNKRLETKPATWDITAPLFDDQPDHGLRDPQIRRAWTDLLKTWLPAAQSSILDVGCGTGSLSVIMAEFGHAVTGIDFSPGMIELAQAKAKTFGCSINFHVMDATAPEFAPQSFDVIVCRHLLWIFADLPSVLQRWADLLKPGGRLMLIEGRWHTNVGLRAPEITAALPTSVTLVSVEDLGQHPDYWGKQVTDERYVIIVDQCIHKEQI
jgi:2-polyprenyl-3-methyl-5-hydroxy-6-metoxy-1,4-benzoquinol methylase